MNYLLKVKYVVLFLFLSSGFCISAIQVQVEEDEQHILQYIANIKKEKLSELRISYNDSIRNLFKDLLKDEASFNYPFDSLKNIQIVTSSDQTFRLYTWNIRLDNGLYENFGFFQYRNPKTNQLSVFELENQSFNYEDPMMTEGNAQNWFGAVYYNLVEKEYMGRKVYTLLGIDYNDGFTKRKVIEPFEIKRGKPVFGKRIIVRGRKLYRRVVFEYMARASMLLTYEEEMNMIVFDHLSYIKPNLKGAQFLAPDSSFDGLLFQSGKWIYKPDIDLRMEDIGAPDKDIIIEQGIK